MLSMLTWVNNPDQYLGLLSTCNDSWEIIKLGQEYNSMAEAYRAGIERATGEYICMAHQDVILRDTLFEERFVKALNKPNVGIVGVIGSVRTVNGSWWCLGASNNRGRVIQGSGDHLLDYTPYDGPCAQVDGLLMGIRKDVAMKHLDELFVNDYNKVHFFDMYLCSKCLELGYTNYIFPTFVQHLSGG